MPLAPAPALSVSDGERRELKQLTNSRPLRRELHFARIVLGAADGVGEGRPRSGPPKEITAAQEAAPIDKTLHSTPKNATHWSVRLMARQEGWSPATVQRIWSKHHLQPHWVDRDHIRAHNKAPQPFQWVAGTNKTIAKVRKYKQTLETGG